MRDKLLLKSAQLHARYPWQIMAVVLILSIIMAFFATRLTVTMRWSDLLPEKDHRTAEYNKIIREFTSASNIVVVVQGREQRIKQFADTLAPLLKAIVDTSQNESGQKMLSGLREQLQELSGQDQKQEIMEAIDACKARIDFPVIQRVDYKIPEKFLRKHGLMLMKTDDLEDNRAIFEDPNLTDLIVHINEVLEKEYVGNEESISKREKRDQTIQFLDALSYLTQTLSQSITSGPVDEGVIESAVDRLLMGDPYFLSYDKSALIMIAVPNFSAVELDRMVSGTDAVQTVLDRTLSDFPDIQAGLTGMIPIGRDEMVYGEQSANITSLIAIVAILILLIVAFRMWIAPLFAILNLLIGILWAIGLTAITVGQLNIMTQMMAVILLGLGIDFSIHFISGFTENRALGYSIAESLESTFLKYGKGILTGGLTTACAFFSLIISSSRGMKEMGLVTGIGMLAVLLTTFMALPTFLVLREKGIEKKRSQTASSDISFRFLGRTGSSLGKHFRFTMIAVILFTGLMLWHGTQITFDQNYMNMEPEGLPSVMLQDTITDKFDLSMDYALVLADSPDESRSLAQTYRQLSTTAMTEDIGLYLPGQTDQMERAGIIRKIRNVMTAKPIRARCSAPRLERLISELDRLAMNIIEIQDMAFLGGQDRVEQKCTEMVGRPEEESISSLSLLVQKLKKQPGLAVQSLEVFQPLFSARFKQQILEMSHAEMIELEDLPSSILDRFINQDSTQFLISVYPKASIWTDMAFLEQFTDDLATVNNRATGMPTIFQALIEIIGKDGRKSLALTLVVVFFLLWIDFKNAGYALIAMVPLIAGVIWMVGLMRICGLQFTVINVMGLPMIIGIGIDDGVHIVHRWLHEGKKDLYKVFSSTGKAILLTTLTTMLAFGSLYFAVWRGFASLGSALFIGVGACFVTTFLFLSGILGLMTRE